MTTADTRPDAEADAFVEAVRAVAKAGKLRPGLKFGPEILETGILSGMRRDRTAAEEIAARYGNDGQCWEIRLPYVPNEGIRRRHLEDDCERARVWTRGEGHRTRYEFGDHSAIVTAQDGWDLGFTGRHLRCVCWPKTDPRHAEGCEEKESWNL